MATTLVTVVTKRAKQRVAEAIGGIISGTLSPGLIPQTIVPVFYQLGDLAGGPIVPPDPTLLVLADGAPFQKAITSADVAVLVPPHTVITTGGAGVDLTVNVAEPTFRVHIFADVNEAVFGPPKTMREFGLFIQFGTNPPELAVYGTFNPGFVKSAGLTVDFFVDVKI